MHSLVSPNYLSDFVVQLLVHSTLIVLVIAGLERLITKGNATLRARLWTLAVLAISLLPLLMIVPKPNLWPAGITPSPIISTDVTHKEAALAVTANAVAARQNPGLQNTGNDQRPWPINISSLIFYAWCLGVALGLLRLALRIQRSNRIREQAEPADNHITTAAVHIANQLAVKPCTDVRLTNEISSPCTLGILKPCILLPENLARHRNKALLEHTLMHELAHIKRGDMQFVILTQIFRALWFFNPALWIASWQAETAREPACDDWVLANEVTPDEYAGSLLSVAEIAYIQPQPVLALHFGNSYTMRSRLRRLIDFSVNHSIRFRPVVATSISVLLCTWILLAAVWFPHAYAEPRADINGAARYLDVTNEGTALIQAARDGHWNTVAALIDAGAYIDQQVENDGTALIAAAAAGHMDIVDLLVGTGADINLAVELDGNPLTAAARAGHFDVVSFLVNNGAVINTYIPLDDTPLINAVMAGDPRIVEFLLANGADPNQSGDIEQGILRTPLSEARRLKQRNIEEMLTTAGARL